MTTDTSDGVAVPAEIKYRPNASGDEVTLTIDPNRFVFRFGLEREALSDEAQRLLREHSAPDTIISQYGLRVYQSTDNAERDRAIDILNRERAVEYAAPVLHRDRGTDDMLVTPNVVVQFKADTPKSRIDEINAQLGANIVSELGYAPNGYIVAAPKSPDGLGAVRLANAYWDTEMIVFAHPDLVSPRHRRSVKTLAPTEPASRAERDASLLTSQWHLETARVIDAWTITKGSPSIHIAILDDGVEIAHPEFAGKIGAQYDFALRIGDGNPKTDQDNHGTACAGVAAASGHLVSGAAPECSLIVGRFPDRLGDADEAEMFRWAADTGADVISCSWGPEDGLGISQPLPGSTQAAIHYCVTKGRGGKGIPICWAAGNGNESADLDGYASNPEVMAIAASTSRETRAFYSDTGNCIAVAAPSSGNSSLGEKRITTTDRTGAAGYNDGSGMLDADVCDDFGGTSSAAPLVAGIVALMLSVNNDLQATPQSGPSQIRDLLQKSADKIGSEYDAGGHSPQFGYGRVDAEEAVRAAAAADTGGSTIRAATITGPEIADRGGSPPQFEVDSGTGPSRYYAVEIATSANLLVTDVGRTAANFFATWNGSLISASPYALPATVWRGLDPQASALYYRAWLSSQQSSWADTVTTTSDDHIADAPSIRLTGQPPGTQSTSSAQPRITARYSADPSSAPPMFDVSPGSGPATYYAVEMATTTALLTNKQGRTADNYYASWTGPLMSTSPYTPPGGVWQRLSRTAGAVYYRAWLSSERSSWAHTVTTTPDADIADCPFVKLTEGGEDRVALARTAVDGARITGPDHVWRDGPPPCFTIWSGVNPFLVVELTTDAGLFSSVNAYRRDRSTYLQSGVLQLRPNSITQWASLAAGWAYIRNADRLYYRLLSASAFSRTPYGYRATVPDNLTDQAPFVKILDAAARHELEQAVPGQRVYDRDELLWRREPGKSSPAKRRPAKSRSPHRPASR